MLIYDSTIDLMVADNLEIVIAVVLAVAALILWKCRRSTKAGYVILAGAQFLLAILFETNAALTVNLSCLVIGAAGAWLALKGAAEAAEMVLAAMTVYTLGYDTLWCPWLDIVLLNGVYMQGYVTEEELEIVRIVCALLFAVTLLTGIYLLKRAGKIKNLWSGLKIMTVVELMRKTVYLFFLWEYDTNYGQPYMEYGNMIAIIVIVILVIVYMIYRKRSEKTEEKEPTKTEKTTTDKGRLIFGMKEEAEDKPEEIAAKDVRKLYSYIEEKGNWKCPVCDGENSSESRHCMICGEKGRDDK